MTAKPYRTFDAHGRDVTPPDNLIAIREQEIARMMRRLDKSELQAFWNAHVSRHGCTTGDCPVEQAIVRVNIALEDMEEGR